MTELRFEVEPSVTIYKESNFPFEEGEEILIKLQIVSIPLLPNEEMSNIVWRGTLDPIGEFDSETDSMLVEVRRTRSPSKVLVSWPFDVENVFNVFTTSEDKDTAIFKTNPVISINAVVKSIQRNPLDIPSMSSTWFATLLPTGQKVGNSVVGNVIVEK